MKSQGGLGKDRVQASVCCSQDAALPPGAGNVSDVRGKSPPSTEKTFPLHLPPPPRLRLAENLNRTSLSWPGDGQPIGVRGEMADCVTVEENGAKPPLPVVGFSRDNWFLGREPGFNILKSHHWINDLILQETMESHSHWLLSLTNQCCIWQKVG